MRNGDLPSSELIAAVLAFVWAIPGVWKERGGKRWRGSRSGGARPTGEAGAGGEEATHGNAYGGRHAEVG